ncbi:MAG: CCA tRNA nucleotidyltransferase, partial [Planctomycetes bacterium]|nr:CCA tRNA nucleotidyltransferase [Planctomycetota bacterium]
MRNIRPPITPAFAHAKSVVRKLHEAGFRAYFVGGCVRDWLLGLSPKDIDIASDALPDQVELLFDHTRAVGKSFGV